MHTYCHIWLAADVFRLCYGVDQSATDTKITELDVTGTVDQHVTWLHV